MWAALAGNVDAARTLVEHGADVTLRAPDGRTVPELATADAREPISRVIDARERR
jgi:ankyrin repeat protein